MRGFLHLAALAATAFTNPLLAAANYLPHGLELAPAEPSRRRAAIRIARSQGRRFPSRGKGGRPGKHRNMNHVSRRVRRKHRRSRK